MALSNWDTSTITYNGQASDGNFRTPLGVEVR